MKKLFLTLLMAVIFLTASNCTAPAPKDNTDYEALIPDEKVVEKKDELQEKAEAILFNMTLEEKIGQLIIVGFPQDVEEEDFSEYLDNLKVSGFILFNRNYKDFDSLYGLIKNLKIRNSLNNPLPLFISVDEEGGTVSRLPKGGTHFPDAQQVGKVGDSNLTYLTGKVIGRELKAAGINLNFAPVLDIVEGSDNKLLIKRSYGSDAKTVSLHGASFIKGLQSEGVIATPKHFPGHGDTKSDSHGELPVINIDENTMESRELIPFKAAIDSGSDAVMVGHIAFPKLDPSGLPATMSRYFLTDILRKELGFMGIAVSDDIEMSGYANGNAPLEECIPASFNAGLDIFVIGHTKSTQEKVWKALEKACREGSISEERLNESVLRIIKVKLKHKLTDNMEYSLEEGRKIFGNKEHKAVLEELKNKIKGPTRQGGAAYQKNNL